MSTTTESVEEIQGRIVQQTPFGILAEYGERIADLLDRQERVSTDHGLEQFVAGHIAEAVQELDRGERESVCNCSIITCPLKRGVVPAPLRIRGSGLLRPTDTRRRAAEWSMDHPGDAASLQEALDEHDQQLSELHRDWMLLHQRMKRNEWDQGMRSPGSGGGHERE